MKTNLFNYSSRRFVPDKNYYNGKGNDVRINKIIRLVGNGKKVLDLGCYDGLIGEKLIEAGNKVWGIDACFEAVEAAKKRGVTAIVGNTEEELPFKTSSFDVVFVGEVIEHILDTDFFIDEIKRVLKPSGELIITTPNLASLGRRILQLLGSDPYFEASLTDFSKNKTSGHIRFFTKKLLKDFLEHKGFKIVFFESDVVNFTSSFGSVFLAKIFPELGRGLIFKCRKN